MQIAVRILARFEQKPVAGGPFGRLVGWCGAAVKDVVLRLASHCLKSDAAKVARPELEHAGRHSLPVLGQDDQIPPVGRDLAVMEKFGYDDGISLAGNKNDGAGGVKLDVAVAERLAPSLATSQPKRGGGRQNGDNPC